MEDYLITKDNNIDISIDKFLNEKEKVKIYKKLLKLVNDSKKPKTQQRLKKIKDIVENCMKDNNHDHCIYHNSIHNNLYINIDFNELKALLPNMYLKEDNSKTGKLLNWLGIYEINDKYALNVKQFLKSLIN